MRRWFCCVMVLAVLGAGLAVAAPAQARSYTRWAYYDPRDPRGYASLQAQQRYLDIVSPAYWRIQPNGTVTSSEQPEVVAQMRGWGLRVMPMVQKYSWFDKMHGWITNPAARTRTADQLAALMEAGDYDGINIDIENIYDDDGGYLTAFLDTLADRLRPAGRTITIAVPARTDAQPRAHRAFDYAAMGQRADLVVVMAYDHGYAAGRPAPVAPLAWVGDVLAYTQARIPNEKILLGIAFYGYDWNTTRGGWARYVGVDEVAGILGARGFDPASGSAWLQYRAGRDTHMVYYENWQSVESKLALVVNADVQGWAAWRLGYEDPGVWSLLTPRR
jgi:spore germination protein